MTNNSTDQIAEDAKFLSRYFRAVISGIRHAKGKSAEDLKRQIDELLGKSPSPEDTRSVLVWCLKGNLPKWEVSLASQVAEIDQILITAGLPTMAEMGKELKAGRFGAGVLYINPAPPFVPDTSREERIAKTITKRLAEGRISDALFLIRVNPGVFDFLSPELKDDECLALAALELVHGTPGSPRLRKDIDFFLRVVDRKVYFGGSPAIIDSARDMIFMREFMRSERYYRSEFTDVDIANRFNCNSDKATEEIQAAARLVDLSTRNDSWMSGRLEESIELLSSLSPGFSELSYRSAFDWAHSRRSAAFASQYF